MKTEQERRIYYQNIVYHVCNALDRIDGKRPGHGIVCGTADEPSTAVQQRIAALANEVLELRTANAHICGDSPQMDLCCNTCKRTFSAYWDSGVEENGYGLGFRVFMCPHCKVRGAYLNEKENG